MYNPHSTKYNYPEYTDQHYLVVKKNDGHSIAVYPEGESNKVKQILLDNRCNFIVKGDYTEGSDMDKVIKNVIDKIAIIEELDEQQRTLAEK